MVIIINFGGQYAHLIARRVRELSVRSELVEPVKALEKIKEIRPDAIVLSGSPFSAYEKNSPKIDKKIYSLKIPILGICYGHQLMANQLGAKVSSNKHKQFGKEIITISKHNLFKGINKTQYVWFSHGDQIKSLPNGFKKIAFTKNAEYAAIANDKHKQYGIQFHAEVAHTPSGMQILKNFLFEISKANKDWDLKKVKKLQIKLLKEKIKKEKIIMAISGGVDSLVAAKLIAEAIDSKLHLVFIDTGLLRKNEIIEVKQIVKNTGLSNLKIINAKKDFLKILKNILDPEEKRKKISKLYFQIFEKEAKKIGKVKFLGQGTIYPDRIESAQVGNYTDKIKSHHNVTLPKGLKLEIIEPLSELYKDEVRSLGKILKIPKEFLNRHPFPGPGLAIRILGEVTEERLRILKEADYLFIEELKKHGIYNKEGQSFAALIPVKTVGVMGDSRTYSYIITLRSVKTPDFMTADWSKLPTRFLEKVSSRIVNETIGVNRVVYDITQKPPATIEYE